MFGLLAGLWEYCFKKDELHVLILGVDKAGKTTLLEKMKSMYTDYMGLEPEKILPTVGLNVGRIEVHKSKLIFWDLGGAPSPLRCLLSSASCHLPPEPPSAFLLFSFFAAYMPETHSLS